MAQKNLVLCIQPQKILNSLVTLTVTMEAGSINDWKSTSRYTFHFGTGVVFCASKKQPIVTPSSVEEEYVTSIGATCQAIWLQRMLKGLLQNQ